MPENDYVISERSHIRTTMISKFTAVQIKFSKVFEETFVNIGQVKVE